MSDLFEILADPKRRRIVETLQGGESAVGDLVDRIDIHQSGVSRHLRILHDAGFVTVRAEGQRRFYSLRVEPFQELDSWIAKYRNLWEARLNRFAVELNRRKKGRVPKRTETRT